MTQQPLPQPLWLVRAVNEKRPFLGTYVESWTRDEAVTGVGLTPEQVDFVMTEQEADAWRRTAEFRAYAKAGVVLKKGSK